MSVEFKKEKTLIFFFNIFIILNYKNIVNSNNIILFIKWLSIKTNIYHLKQNQII